MLTATFASRRPRYCHRPSLTVCRSFEASHPPPYSLSTLTPHRIKRPFYIVNAPCVSRRHSASTADPPRRTPQSPHDPSPPTTPAPLVSTTPAMPPATKAPVALCAHSNTAYGIKRRLPGMAGRPSEGRQCHRPLLPLPHIHVPEPGFCNHCSFS